MSSLKESARYDFTVPAKFDTEGAEVAPAKVYHLRRLSLREREEQFGSRFESLQIVAGQYINEGSQRRLQILHRDLVETLRLIASRDFVAEVESWIGKRGAGPQVVALTALIMTEEGIINPAEDADPEDTLPSEDDIEHLDQAHLEVLGKLAREVPDDFYIALRLSGGDLLKWCRIYGDYEADDLKDVPVRLLSAWFSRLDALRRIDMLEQTINLAAASGLGVTEESKKENFELLQQMKRDAGLMRPLVPTMRATMDDYNRTKIKYAGFGSKVITLPDGTQMTYQDTRVWDLRQKCLAAVRSLATGVRLA